MRSMIFGLPFAAACLCFGAGSWAAADSPTSGPAKPPEPMTGLIWMSGKVSDGPQWVEDVERTLQANPHLSGLFLNARWTDLEPARGQFDWKTLDAGIEAVRRHKRFYKIVLTPGAYTPAWVYEQGVKVFETLGPNPYRKETYNKPIRIPVPWDPVFLKEYEQFVGAVGQRYSSDPLCAAVGVTGANFQSAEMHLPKQAADLDKWEALDYRSHLAEAYRRYIDLFATAFPRQRLCLHVSVAIWADDGIAEQAAAYGAERYPDRFTLQNCQLSGKGDNGNLYSYALIEKYAGRLHVGYQSLAALGAERQGDSAVTVYNFVHGRGEYWELWHGNGQDSKLCAWLLDEIARGRKMGAEAYRAELEAAGKFKSGNQGAAKSGNQETKNRKSKTKNRNSAAEEPPK